MKTKRRSLRNGCRGTTSAAGCPARVNHDGGAEAYAGSSVARIPLAKVRLEDVADGSIETRRSFEPRLNFAKLPAVPRVRAPVVRARDACANPPRRT